MKNAIQYYYHLIPSDIRQNKKSYFFSIGDQHYYLTPCERNVADINILYDVSVQLFQKSIFCHQFVTNVSGEIVTMINQIPYVLFRVFVTMEQKVTMEDVLYFSTISLYVSKVDDMKRNHWREMWITKNDYFEYQVSEFGKKFPLIRESFSYYLGMSEIGIMLLQQVPAEAFSKVVLSHRRVSSTDTLLEFYNPLNFILDIRVRDISEYFKEKVIQGEISATEILDYCLNLRFDYYELLLLFIRMLYPSFYYDRYEKIIEQKEEEEILEDIIGMVDCYELVLKELYVFVKQYVHIDTIYWLEKR